MNSIEGWSHGAAVFLAELVGWCGAVSHQGLVQVDDFALEGSDWRQRGHLSAKEVSACEKASRALPLGAQVPRLSCGATLRLCSRYLQGGGDFAFDIVLPADVVGQIVQVGARVAKVVVDAGASCPLHFVVYFTRDTTI